MFLSIILATPPPSHGAIYIAGGFKKKYISCKYLQTLCWQYKHNKKIVKSVKPSSQVMIFHTHAAIDFYL